MADFVPSEPPDWLVVSLHVVAGTKMVAVVAARLVAEELGALMVAMVDGT